MANFDRISADSINIVYLQCAMVCESSLLTTISCAVPAKSLWPNDKSVKYARDVFRLHEQCLESLQQTRNLFFFASYLNW